MRNETPSKGRKDVFFGFALGPRDPSRCVGFAVQGISMGLTRSELDSATCSMSAAHCSAEGRRRGKEKPEPVGQSPS
jgi:hypothetical protein